VGDGTARIYKVATSAMATKVDAAKEEYTPCTVVKWSPKKDTLLCIAGCSNGSFTQFQAVSGLQVYHAKEEKNQILTLDYDPTGDMFATAGKDYNVKSFALLLG
jgi:WD40 repeat protein